MSTTKKTKAPKGKEAIGSKPEKALKDVFLEEATNVRLRLSILEKSVKTMEDILSKVRDRLGLWRCRFAD